MEDCKTLWSHLKQSVRGGRLKQFLYQPNEQGGQVGSGSQRDTSLRPPLGMINVILAAPRRTGFEPSRVKSITRPPTKDSNLEPKKGWMEVRLALSFSNKNKVGTL